MDDRLQVSTKLKVGFFGILGMIGIVVVTILVNNRPMWWRECNLVTINVKDATGLKMKSPVRSLGLQVGYIQAVRLSETHVRLGLCLTEDVKVLPSTRAYVRPEGFLGDQFVELKPIQFVGEDPGGLPKAKSPKVSPKREQPSSQWSFPSLFWSTAYAQESGSSVSAEIPMGEGNENINQVVKKVDRLVSELSDLTSNIKTAIDPKQLKATIEQLNRTLENAAATLSPEGGLTTTAQRTLAKLEDSIEQLRQILTRVNQGEGSIGMVINDPSYAEELKSMLKNVNLLLSKTSSMRLVINVSAVRLNAYQDSRGTFSLGIWPEPDRYYLIGISTDPRGKVTRTVTTTEVGGVSTTTETTQVEESGLLLTAMLGKVLFRRLELAVGVRHGDGVLRTSLHFGPRDDEERFQLLNELYSRQIGSGTAGTGINDRLSLLIYPIRSPFASAIYIQGGLESFKKVNGKTNYSFGAGLAFDDNDIKVLFSFL